MSDQAHTTPSHTHDAKGSCCTPDGSCKTGSCCSPCWRNPITIGSVIVAIAALGYAFMGGASPSYEPAKTPKEAVADLVQGKDEVVARVDGKNVMKSDVAFAITQMGMPVKPEQIEQILPVFLEQYLNLRLINKAALASSVGKDEKVEQQLAASREQIMRAAYIESLFAGKITDEALQALYKERYETAAQPTELRARHILVDDEAKAKEIIERLKKGAKFEDMAKEFSKDPSAERGGDLGYFIPEDMVKEFADAAFGLENGKFTETPVKTQFGWHIIKAEDRRVREKPTFEAAKPALEQQMRQKLIDEKLVELRKTSKVEVLLEGAKPLPAPAPAQAVPAPTEATPSPSAPAEAPKAP